MYCLLLYLCHHGGLMHRLKPLLKGHTYPHMPTWFATLEMMKLEVQEAHKLIRYRTLLSFTGQGVQTVTRLAQTHSKSLAAQTLAMACGRYGTGACGPWRCILAVWVLSVLDHQTTPRHI